uniref:Uncharacterized protein n=1 Tax=Chelonoidis abingdonii TaxID=106734 RepID=A0A8C0GNI1_CHEAB
MLGIKACGRISLLATQQVQRPAIPLPEKIGGDFIPHVQDWVGFIFNLLTGEALALMSPILEQSSSLLNQLVEFIHAMSVIFDSNLA